jgi:hypothetical protein
MFDFSNLDKSHELYDDNNRGVVGLFKIVQDKITSFYGVSCTQYSLGVDSSEQNSIIKCGGIPKAWVEANLKHEMFKEAIINGPSNLKHTMHTLRAVNGEVVDVQFSRKGIGCLDLKRLYINDYLSYPFGHYKIKEHLASTKLVIE